MLPTLNAARMSLGLDQVLLFAYLVTLWAGGWVLEFLARAHFHRAERYAHRGFSYDAELDRYECPQGELLTLDTFDGRNKLAIYKAPAASCNECVLKPFCTPHDEGRRVYRSLAAFHETDVGRFHRRLSLTVVAVALAFAVAGVVAYRGTPGEWLQVVAAGIAIVLLWLDVRDAPEQGPRAGRGREGDGVDEWRPSDSVGGMG
jgi:hypothetical protein